ncbi:EscR/YscR/HrcR family type III secretion system export apparatus protein [Hahella sp. CCB-MM4]|uniref:type III secretion system export apparatus subunit SctR n=1 Tax=Hahella sp. (strain CCB-MM4) TaxID=1926491 RepID=UPI000B9B1FB0|nr:type III secretion system export apparatus subunit SctR [Hahella sp. CCB-MM4]OZG74346.1 EscR/YscR/HrcR family type III secretion system export apparatus protein [Hahella sp. CCB-MM4]
MSTLPDPFYLILGLALIALIPFFAVMATSFVKIAVVIGLLRNALGIQQIPPNMAIYGLSIILTAYIMAPVGIATYEEFIDKPVSLENTEELKAILDTASKPYKDFLIHHGSEDEQEFFLETALEIWPEEIAKNLDEHSFFVLIPAFTASELTSAFEVGFLIYLPFLAIDLIISNILLAMGMMMVSPMTISLPFKLLLFVLMDGWTRLIHGLVLAYQ